METKTPCYHSELYSNINDLFNISSKASKRVHTHELGELLLQLISSTHL